ncbi:MAG: CBS domain-containing protein [Hyphomicrobiaceae bacterium]
MNTAGDDPTGSSDTCSDVRSPPVPEQARIAAANVMTRAVVSVGPHTRVRDIARVMSEHKFSAVPVVDDLKVIGIVTEEDLLRREELGTAPSYCVAESSDPACQKSHGPCAHDVMSAPVVDVGEKATLAEIAELMEKRRIRHVLVITEGRLAGIISRADLVRTLIARPDDAHAPLACDDDIVRFKVIDTLLGIRGASAWLTEVTVTNGAVDLSGVVEDENVRDLSRQVIEDLSCVVSVSDRRAILQPY